MFELLQYLDLKLRCYKTNKSDLSLNIEHNFMDLGIIFVEPSLEHKHH
jgi:hypothetical protein